MSGLFYCDCGLSTSTSFQLSFRLQWQVQAARKFTHFNSWQINFVYSVKNGSCLHPQAGFSPRRSGFLLRVINFGFIVDKVTLEEFKLSAVYTHLWYPLPKVANVTGPFEIAVVPHTSLQQSHFFPNVFQWSEKKYFIQKLNNIVIWRLKAGILEPEEKFIARQRLAEQISAAMDTKATIEELLWTMFSIRFVANGYKEESSTE
jgi:hypothetical protein